MQQGEVILDRYRVLEVAGKGGYGTVCVAWDTRIKRRVAVKCLPLPDDIVRAIAEATYDNRIDRSTLNNPYDAEENPSVSLLDETPFNESAARWEDLAVPGLEEARTAALLSDPTIVGVLDFEVQHDVAYLIMEYVEGMTLGAYLRQRGDDITADEIAAVVHDVACALSVAHENGVLHLDVKPDNMLINRQGHIKVTDFGLAELAGAFGYGDAQGGTIGYMPLEQMAREPLDERCDQWAFASVIYEMIAGENPFRARDIPQAKRAIEQAELVLPSLCLEGIDAAADDIIFQALDPLRSERFDSVQEFAAELAPLIGSPEKGRSQLAHEVTRALDDTGEQLDPQAAVRVAKQVVRSLPIEIDELILRIGGALCGGLLTYRAALSIPFFANATLPAGVLAACVVGIGMLIFPQGAILVVSVALLAAMISLQAYLPAVAFIVATIAWWWKVGRFGLSEAISAPSVALFGIGGMPSASAVLAGYELNVRDALVSALYTWLMTVMLAGFGSARSTQWNPVWEVARAGGDFNTNVIAALMQIPTWILLVTLVATAVLVAWFCTRGKRRWACVGMFLAAGLLAFMACLETLIVSGGVTFSPDMLHLVLSVTPALVGAALALWKVPARAQYVDPDEVWDPDVQER